jgi:hypothetical protein
VGDFILCISERRYKEKKAKLQIKNKRRRGKKKLSKECVPRKISN